MQKDRLRHYILHYLDCIDVSNEDTIIVKCMWYELPTTRTQVALQYSGPRAQILNELHWMEEENLVMRKVCPIGEKTIDLTRRGSDALAQTDIVKCSLAAIRLVDNSLHQSLQLARLRFLEGLYGDSVSTALHSIEARIRVLANVSDSDMSGKILMKRAFRKKSPLANEGAAGTSSRAILDLALGLISYNAHDLVEPPDDLDEIVEIVLATNLLHRHLDRVETRIGASRSDHRGSSGSIASLDLRSAR